MFDWSDRNTKAVYKLKFLPFLPLLASLIIFCYLLGSVFIFPLTEWVVCFCYPFGFRIACVLAPLNSLVNYPTITPPTVFLVAVFVASWASFTVLAWDIHFVAALKDVKGYERYRDVKSLLRFLMRKGGRKRLVVTLGPVLPAVVFLLTTAWILSWVVLSAEWITSAFFWLLVSAALLNVLYMFTVREFITKHTGTYAAKRGDTSSNVETSRRDSQERRPDRE